MGLNSLRLERIDAVREVNTVNEDRDADKMAALRKELTHPGDA